MDFGTYPPEINSLRMYTGPGAAPMLTAAQAWQGLAAELHSAASSYQSVDFGPDCRAVAGARINVDGCRRGVLRRMAERHRRAGRGNGRASQNRSRRIPNGVHVDGAAANGGR